MRSKRFYNLLLF